MFSYFDELKDFALSSGSDWSLICRLHGYTVHDCISKMKKSELARKLSDLQFILRVVYENGSLNKRG